MKLHTGRSRNDQNVTDTRLWLRDNALNLENHIAQLIDSFLNRAHSEIEVLMPGYTHLQVNIDDFEKSSFLK